jgi:hypothetical protein
VRRQPGGLWVHGLGQVLIGLLWAGRTKPMGNEASRPALAPMDDRKWIAIMVAAMLLLVGIAALLVKQPELVTNTHAVMSR